MSTDGFSEETLGVIYANRHRSQKKVRRDVWDVLCRHFLQQFVPQDGTVIDVGAGRCEFINAIKASRKVAVDLAPDTETCADDGVEVIHSGCHDLSVIGDASADAVFVSNVFEHLTRPEILATIRECRRCLRSGGRLIILQPNIRYAYREYWTFFDHITALDHDALCEALVICELPTERVIPRFLPYTMSGRPSRLQSLWPILLRIYLAMPWAWRFVAKQCLIVAVKP